MIVEKIAQKFNQGVIFALFIPIFISSYVLFKEPFEFYIGYLVMMFFLPFFLRKMGVPKIGLYLLLILLFVGIYNIQVGNNTYVLFFKIYLGLIMTYFFYYYVIESFDENVEQLFKWYLKGALLMSYIGLFQFISYHIGFKAGYNYTWFLNKSGPVLGGNLGIRINSLYPEPSQYAIIQSPLFFISILNFILPKDQNPFYFSKWKSAVAIVTYLLTFSSLGYFVIFIFLILYFINYGILRYLLFMTPVIIGIFYILYKNVPEFSSRIDDSFFVFDTGEFTLGDTHGSSIILYDNYKVSIRNFSENPLFGTGLGSHKIAFDRFSVTKHIQKHGFAGNSADANSMFLRTMSEVGLIGIIGILYFIFTFYVRRINQVPNTYWIISNAILGLMILQLFRQGHYFLNGFPFFALLYFYTYKANKKSLMGQDNLPAYG